MERSLSCCCSQAWEKQMQSAMQHRSAPTSVDDEDNGEQVERESVAPRKMLVQAMGGILKLRKHMRRFCGWCLSPAGHFLGDFSHVRLAIKCRNGKFPIKTDVSLNRNSIYKWERFMFQYLM